jgi:3-hydroxyisobutyrate dehydrogenase-like beta-hydroxyacid dehydrogenase
MQQRTPSLSAGRRRAYRPTLNEGSRPRRAEPARMAPETGTIAVLGLGEAGSLIARDLVHAGQTVRGWDPDLHGDLSEITVAPSHETAVDGADVVLSVNWAIVAADVARRTLPYLRPGVIYADLNTGGPRLKRELAAIVAPSGAAFVDVAMMAPVPPLGVRVPMFLAGDGAEALAEILRKLGTPVEVVGAEPGEAAARKLTRSVFFKGMSAAVCEALEAARAAGVEDWLRADITRTLVGADAATLGRIVTGTHKHAKRRAHEMADAAALLEELGVPTTITRATTESLERLAAANPSSS